MPVTMPISQKIASAVRKAAIAPEMVIAHRLRAAKLEMIKAPEFAQGSKSAGIVELKGDELRICYAAEGGAADSPRKCQGFRVGIDLLDAR